MDGNSAETKMFFLKRIIDLSLYSYTIMGSAVVGIMV